jgi:hypothetical protein
VLLAPSMLAIGDAPPIPATWNAWGRWTSRLLEKRDVLPENVSGKVRGITAGMTDTIEIMKTIYRYFQENTRYVSVQIGIGGYQPADALAVAKNGYGDCKALVNYMQAMLRVAGIPSRYALVVAGIQRKPVRKEFPCLQFNHVILCVPLMRDTIWLECTSQTIPFGYLGSFTCNRDVLLITSAGGEFARTPEYPARQNTLQRKVVVAVDSAGNARIRSTVRLSGLLYEQFEGRFHQSREEQKKEVREELDLPAVNILQVAYRKEEGRNPSAMETLEMDIPAFASVSGNKVFIPLNVFDRVHTLPPPGEPRSYPFDPGIAHIDLDSIEITLPAPMTLESLPETVEVETRFGHYRATVTGNGREILFIRSLTASGDLFPPEDYPAFYDFIRRVSKADKSSAVFKM